MSTNSVLRPDGPPCTHLTVTVVRNYTIMSCLGFRCEIVKHITNMQVILNLKTDLMDCVPGSVGHVAADAAVVAAVDLGRVSAFSGSEIQILV